MVQVCSKKIEKSFKKNSNLTCTQIWLKFVIYHYHFSYNTNLTKNKNIACCDT